MSRLHSSLHRLNTAALDLAPKPRRFLYIWTYLSGLLAIQILHLALDELILNVWLSLALSAGFVYSFNLAPRWRPITTYGVSLVAFGLSIFFFFKLQSDIWLAGGTLGVLLGLLMVLLSFKAFAPSDHRFIILVCVIFIIYSAHQSYDLKLMLMLPAFLFCAGCSLYAASQIEVATRVSQTVGGEMGETLRDTRIEVGPHFLSMLLKAVVGLIIFSAVAFVLTPHSEEGHRHPLMNTAPPVDPVDPSQASLNQSQPNRDNRNKPNEAEIGLGEDFDLSEGSKLSADPRPVLQMKSHRAGYLRAQVYDVYTGSSWVKSPLMDNPAMATLIARRGEEAVNTPGLAYAEGLESISALVQGSEPDSSFSVPLLDFPSQDVAKVLSRTKKLDIAKDNAWSANQASDPNFDEIHQDIKLLEDLPPFYFSMYAPYRLENISLTHGGSLNDIPLIDAASCIRPQDLKKQYHRKNFSYTVRSLELRYKESDLKEVLNAGPPAITEKYTQLPLRKQPLSSELGEYGIDPAQYRPLTEKVVNLSLTVANRRDFRSGQPSIYDKVQNIYNYLTDPEEFEYTRNYVEIQGDREFTEQFLFDSQQGHCRYFASTMAVMCRINGIPARVVSGYAPGSFSLVENAYVYHASNAHAWVEVYFDGFGWIRFDPSPAAAENERNGGGFQRGLRNTIDFLTNLFVLDPAATQKLIADGLKQLWALMIKHGPQSLILLAAVILVLFAYIKLRDNLSRRRMPMLRPENEVIAAYLQALRLLARLGLARGEVGITARRAFVAAGSQHEVLQEPLYRLLPLYERAAFSGQDPASEDVQEARAAVDQLTELVNRLQEEMKKRRRGG